MMMTSNNKERSLDDLGYNDFFESKRKELELLNFSVARVMSERKGEYTVRSERGEYVAKVSGKHMFNAAKREDFPAVGDWVAIVELENNTASIQKVLPRRTVIKKKYNNKDEIQIIAANVDVAFIVEAVDRDFNLNRLERYVIMVQDEHIEPIIVLNKIDLISEEGLQEKLTLIGSRFKEIRVIANSTISKQGTALLIDSVERGITYCFLGSSGVGKSSIVNRLIGEDIIEVDEIGQHSGRGKHTTTQRNTYIIENGGIVIDNPGMREVGVVDADIDSGDVYEEIETLSKQCKYSDCTHTCEPDCAILKAVEGGMFDKDKYQNFVRLKKEADHYAMTKFEKRKKDKKFGKFVKRTLQQSKKYKGD